MNDNVSKMNPDFHAGHFLRDMVARSGHDVAWLSAKTGRKESEIERLFLQPNMDATLFVSMGLPLGNVFYDRVHEMVFGASQTTLAS